jgi:hypothetical protein
MHCNQILCSYLFTDTDEHFVVYQPFVSAQSSLVDKGSPVLCYLLCTWRRLTIDHSDDGSKETVFALPMLQVQ